MILLDVDNSNQMTFEHEGHVFVVAASDLSNPTGLDGNPDTALYVTPLMSCVNCGQQAQTIFPVSGDGNAQVVHAYGRAVKQGIDLDTAVDQVVAAAHAKGGKARVQANNHKPNAHSGF